ncbi:MAG TPA: S8 family serine peptidase [Methanotrichaceae archaeon]|nr:S8 family serine peptidase [Methanotrichaceae archaeon]HQF16362.1 S8 family serine peptidase [Methanotrichaceae archaeon]HQI91024.1 S8 family serine peptidase [Methanotrichaceae archaeon]
MYDAWDMGYTGKGVNVAVIDESIDFATPDLIGTQARVSNKSSPYYGWPIVIDTYSLKLYQQNRDHPQNSIGNWYQYADTKSTDVGWCIVTGSSKSGVYHIGDHPDSRLSDFYGQPVKVLVADEERPGDYDTVYVDLNCNHDFRDDKPCRRGDEISYWDRDEDGYPDESGGMVYFIADGKTPLPLSRLLYDKEAKLPGNGELVAFHYATDSHGTACASIIAAQGRNVLGIAKDARVVSVKNIPGENQHILGLLASLGYDGIADTGDEASVLSVSSMNSQIPNKGSDEVSAFFEYITTVISPNTTIVYANGNDGSGYSTCTSPSGKHVINVGASYNLWVSGSTYRDDIIAFSSRGPNALGQLKPNVIAPAESIPKSLSLLRTLDGRSAWNGFGGGTSSATPHVAAVVALIYQAYKEKNGVFPTSEKARDILMSSSTDIGEEVFAQGSGIINAKRAVEMASGNYGVLAEPALLVTDPVKAGSVLQFNLTLTDYSHKQIEIEPQILINEKINKVTLETSNENLTFQLPNDILDCDLLTLCSYYPRQIRSTRLLDFEGYDLCLYNWKDENHDLVLQEDELEIIAGTFEKWGLGITSEARMSHPKERTDDGIVARLMKRGEIQSDIVTVVIETYNWKPWDIVVFNDGGRVNISIPTPNATGIYQGKLQVKSDGQKQSIPISFMTYGDDQIRINDTQDRYKNGKMYGRFEGDCVSGWDTRSYAVHHDGDDLATIEVAWDDPNSDIDVFMYGEGEFNSSDFWKYPARPPVGLPALKIWKENGHSRRMVGFAAVVRGDKQIGGSYRTFYTSTGQNKEIITSEMTDGLNLIVLEKVIDGGNKYGENVTINLSYTQSQNLTLQARSGEIMDMPEGIDGITGFSQGVEVQGEDYPKEFQADKDDVILIQSEENPYWPMIVFDSDNNGSMEWDGLGLKDLESDEDRIANPDADELIFSEYRPVMRAYPSMDMVKIAERGTYFLLNFGKCYRFYHLKATDQRATGESMKIKAPEQSGSYLGIAEKDGILIPVTVKLLVEPGDPVSIGLKFDNITERNQSFQVELELQDRFGNLVEQAVEATVEFDNVSRIVNLDNGLGVINLTAPTRYGSYKIVATSRYGVTEKEIEISELAALPTADGNISSDIASQVTEETSKNISEKPRDITELPKKVQSVTINSTDCRIMLSWPPSYDAERYNVYRLRFGNFEKAAEVNVTEYAMAAEFWKSYTFRVSAISSEGDEGEPSDPVAIVVTP